MKSGHRKLPYLRRPDYPDASDTFTNSGSCIFYSTVSLLIRKRGRQSRSVSVQSSIPRGRKNAPPARPRAPTQESLDIPQSVNSSISDVSRRSNRPRGSPSPSVMTHQSNTRSDFMGYDLETLRPLSEISSRPSSFKSWEPYDLPDIPADMFIGDWSHLASGTHGSVRKVHLRFGNFDGIFCLKLFSEEWKNAYEREVESYSLMIHRKVKRCIPEVYFKGALPLSVWNGSRYRSQRNSATLDEEDEIYYGIVMEYFDDFREVDFEKIDVDTATAVAKALTRIHQARIRHGDLQEQNILLVRQAGNVRVVWIDFSCAWINAYGGSLNREWDSLLGDLGGNPEITDQLIDDLEDFRAAQTRHDRTVSPEHDNQHIPDVPMNKRLHYLRIAYSLSLYSQLPALFIVENRHNSATLLPSTFHFSLVSLLFLGFLFFSLRNKQNGTAPQRNLTWVFVGHSCIWAGISIKELALVLDSKMAFDNILFKLVMIFGAVHNFMDALVGIVALDVSSILTEDQVGELDG